MHAENTGREKAEGSKSKSNCVHPFWQRTIVPALMNVAQILSKEVHTQMLVATHSPLVLASVEPLFDADKDTLFHLSLENGLAKLENVPFEEQKNRDARSIYTSNM